MLSQYEVCVIIRCMRNWFYALVLHAEMAVHQLQQLGLLNLHVVVLRQLGFDVLHRTQVLVVVVHTNYVAAYRFLLFLQDGLLVGQLSQERWRAPGCLHQVGYASRGDPVLFGHVLDAFQLDHYLMNNFNFLIES